MLESFPSNGSYGFLSYAGENSVKKLSRDTGTYASCSI